MAPWIVVKRKLKSFQMMEGDISVNAPALCPNCGGTATVMRTCSCRGFGAAYTGSFGYCQACADQVDAAWAISKSFAWLMLLGLFLGATFGLLGSRMNESWRSETVMGMGLAVGAAIGVAGWWAFRRHKIGKHPLRETQAVWGPASYYGGTRFMGVREDWIRELVRLNQDLFDDAVREKWSGEPGPQA